MNRKIIAVDLGGTSIQGALVHTSGEVLQRKSMETPPLRMAVLDGIASLICALSDNVDEVIGVGVGTPGTVDPERGIITSIGGNVTDWTHTPLREELQKRGIKWPIWVDNDATMAAWGEYEHGAGKGAFSMLMLTLGTGLGGAYVEAGELLRGAHGMAGELGHMILYPGGRLCACGQRGCVERYVSGTGLALTYQALTGEIRSSHWVMSHRDSDPDAGRAVEQLVEDFSWYLVSLKNAFDPEVVVIGGGLADTYDVWGEQVQAMACDKLNVPSGLKLRKSVFGNDAGLVGAALRVVKSIEDQSHTSKL